MRCSFHVFLARALALALCPAIAAAQTTTSEPSSIPPLESVTAGIAVGGGSPGGLASFRVSTPLDRKNALDFDLGHIMGNGSTYGLQFRRLFRERSAAGGSAYLLVGVSHVNLETQTEVRWPGGVVTYLTKRGPSAIPHLGVGGDWVTADGLRVGFEVTSGGGEWIVLFAKFFVQWGPATR